MMVTELSKAVRSGHCGYNGAKHVPDYIATVAAESMYAGPAADMNDFPQSNSEIDGDGLRSGSENAVSSHQWHVTAAGCALAAIALSTYIAGAMLPSTDASQPHWLVILANFLAFHVVAVVAVLAVVHRRVRSGRRLDELALATSPTWADVGRALIAATWLVPMVLVLHAGILAILAHNDMAPTPDPVVDWLTTAEPREFVLLVVGAVIIAPFAEELLFRLVFYRAAATVVGDAGATAAASLLFAVIHFRPEQILPLFVLAVVLQRMFNRRGSLWLPIAIHAVFNAVMVVLVIVAGSHLPPID